MYTEFQKLQSAVRLPSAEQALAAFKDIADLNARYEDKYDNILHYMISAFEKEHLRIADFKALIESGVDVNARDKEGQSPLHYTTLYPNFALAKILISHDADIHAEDKMGNTVLWRAVKNYRGEKELLDIILLLLEKGADINKKNNYDRSSRDMIEDRKANITSGSAESDLSEALKAYL